MKPKVELVMLCAKFMDVTEETVVGCGIIYNSGKGWRRHLYRDDLEAAYKEYSDNCVSDETVDFALDFMSGRIPLNLLMNVLTALAPKPKGEVKKK